MFLASVPALACLYNFVVFVFVVVVRCFQPQIYLVLKLRLTAETWIEIMLNKFDYILLQVDEEFVLT